MFISPSLGELLGNTLAGLASGNSELEHPGSASGDVLCEKQLSDDANARPV